jgi:hypothetical protein
MTTDIIWILHFVPIRKEPYHRWVAQNNKDHLPTLVIGQRLSAFSKSKAVFTFSYRLAGRSVTNEGNVLKLHGISL